MAIAAIAESIFVGLTFFGLTFDRGQSGPTLPHGLSLCPRGSFAVRDRVWPPSSDRLTPGEPLSVQLVDALPERGMFRESSL